MKVRDEFHIAFAALARAAPQEWERALAEYAAFVQSLKDELVAAHPSSFQVVQGSAVQAVAMGKLLATVKETADKLLEKQKK